MSILEDYKVSRRQKEEEKKRSRVILLHHLMWVFHVLSAATYCTILREKLSLKEMKIKEIYVK